MPHHDLSRIQSHVHSFKHKLKPLLKRKRRRLDPPPKEPDFTEPPPDHWMGFWICSSCISYAYPKYSRGSHPFSYLWCYNPSCRRVITHTSTSSTFLHRLQLSIHSQTSFPVPRLTGPHKKQIPYLSVCQCGLTHRARLYRPDLYTKWKQFPKESAGEPWLRKLRRFIDHREDPEITLIQFDHVQCNKCLGGYDAYRWQHFMICYDGMFHIDGKDEHGRWTEVRYDE